MFWYILAMVLQIIKKSLNYWKKDGWILFFEMIFYKEIVKIKTFQEKILSIFQYFDRNIASRETNDTSTESSDTKLLADGKWHYQEGSSPTCWKKDTEKKGKFNGAKSGRNFFLIPPILFLYCELSVCPLILNYNKIYFGASPTARSNIHTYIKVR